MTHWAGEYPGELIRAFFAQFTMEASLRIPTKPRAPTSLIAFLAAAFQIPPLRSTSPFCHGASDAVKYCRIPWASTNSPSSPSKLTSHVGDQVTHGTCPIYPNHLKHRQDVIRPFGWHWKANVESRGEISYPMLRNSNTCLPESASMNRSIPTP